MSFLQPQYLWGLLALAIPLIIHLFNFRRIKKVYFSNSRFLKQIKESNTTRQRLKHLLVLASRMLFIIFLVLAFAQPVILNQDESLTTETVAIYLDNSMSMSNNVAANIAAFDQSINQVSEILDLYPKETRFKLLTNEFAPSARRLKTKQEITEMVTELELSHVTRDFTESWQRLATWENNNVAGHDYYVLSDFQQETMGDPGIISEDTSITKYLIPQDFESTNNLFIDSVYLKNPLVVTQENNEIEVSVKNTGSTDVNDLIVVLSINDKQVASASLDIPSQASRQANMSINFDLDETNRCKLSFEDFPVAFDNDFYFTLNQAERIAVLEIKAEEAVTPTESVYANTNLFDFNSSSSGNLDYNLIKSQNLVILNGLEIIPPSLSTAINQFIESGGHLLVAPAAKPDLASYQNLVFFPGLKTVTDSVSYELNAPNVNHPYFQNIFESNQGQAVSMPKASSVFTWGRGSSDHLLTFKNGTPFLSVNARGNTYLLATPLQSNHTNFHQHAIFVPVMYRTAALSKADMQRLYYSTSEPVIQLQVDSVSQNSIFKMDNGTEEIIPNQRVVAGELYLEMPKNTLQAGFYDLKLDQSIQRVLPFNHDKTESVLKQYRSAELKDRFKNDASVKVLDANDFEQFNQKVVQAQSGLPLWKYALIVALLFLLAEVLLIRFLK